MSQTAVLELVNKPATIPLQPINRISEIQSQESTLQSSREVDNNDALPSGDHMARESTNVTKITTACVITSVTLISAVGSMISGLLVVAIPQIALDTDLPQPLLLWPASIYALVCGCTLLLFGSVTDVVGSRLMYLTGCFLQACFTLACGFSQTGTQLIVFRAFGGIANSMCLPSAVKIITNTFPTGQRRNVAFACMGGGQPLGFSAGLTIGGVLSDTIGWRWGLFISAAITAAVFVLACFVVLKDEHDKEPIAWKRLKEDVDWVGAITASLSLAGLSYTFASISASVHDIAKPATASIFAISLALIPAFIYWMHRQTSRGRVALIPNSFWRNKTFTAINICVFLIWGSFNALEQILTFYFQYSQRATALKSALYFLPMPITGTLVNILMIPLVKRVKAHNIVIISTLISIVPGAVMAFASPTSSYWSTAFIATLLSPVAADCLYTISNLVITNIFPKSTQALAGGVFNTVSQIGSSFALGLSAVIANSVSANAISEGRQQQSHNSPEASSHLRNEADYPPDALMEGYRAAFWFCFALTTATLFVTTWGLRAAGKVGEKTE